MRHIFSVLVLFFSIQLTQAQVIGDVLRYSNTEVTGTARALGLGGAISAIGSDYSVLSKNPAGLAWYRKSELVLTPSVNVSKVSSKLVDGNERNSSKSNFNFNNVGFVANGTPQGSNWTTINFGFGYNKLANFNQNFNFKGETEGSITDRFLELASDPNSSEIDLSPDDLDNFEAGLAYEAGAIYLRPNGTYASDFVNGELVEKSQVVQSSGGINELVFSLAGNYDEKLMIGATVGIPIISFTDTKFYRELDEDDSNPVFGNLEFRENITTTGSGVNLKLGFIYRATQAIRIGAAVHTPTSFRLEDNYSNNLEYSYFDGSSFQNFEATSPDGVFEYKIKTPWTVLGSAAYIIQKMGLVTAEVEWSDYSSAAFNFNNSTSSADLDYEEELNAQIQERFKSAIKIRLGGEFAYKKLRFRAGYGLNGSPYVDDNSTYNSLSAGVGVREKSFYLDFGYRRSAIGETYVPYVTFDTDINPQQVVLNDINNDTFLMTIGFRF